jgi:hypothetical protein
MNEFVQLEILVNRETLGWLEEEAQRIAATQHLEHQGAIGPSDVVSMIVERTRAAANPADSADYVDSQGNRWFRSADSQQSAQEALQRPAADEGGYTGPASTS